MSSCGGCLLPLVLFGIMLTYGLGILSGILYQISGQGDAAHRFNSFAALLLSAAIVDAGLQVIRRITKRSQAAAEKFKAEQNRANDS